VHCGHGSLILAYLSFHGHRCRAPGPNHINKIVKKYSKRKSGKKLFEKRCENKQSGKGGEKTELL
jgi:hypothetical protein